MDQNSKPIACPSCGGEIPVGAPTGWCPRCALALLLADSPADKGLEVLSLQDIPPPGTSVSYIGDYELMEVIAHGGMGVVYKARQKSLNRIVALKLLLGGAHASADFRKRFRQEAELAAQLHHPNIVPIYEAGEHEGQPYFSMEYVPGQDLANLTRGKPLPPQQAAQYLKTIAEAVHYAHLQGVLHRDLKPSNVLLGSDGRLRITDFGLAKRFADSSTLTLSGSTLGTPGYLPPEQVSTKRGTVGVHSDVYSLGAILYHLLTGRAPFQGEAPADVLMQVLSDPPVPASEINPLVPLELDRICLKCLVKDPGKRLLSAQELAQALDEPLVLHPRKEARTKSGAFRFFSARKAVWVGLASIFLVLAACFWLGRSSKPSVTRQFARMTNSLGTNLQLGRTAPTKPWTNSLGMVLVPAPDTKVLFSIWDTRVQDFAAFVKETGHAATNGMFSLSSDGWKQRGDSWINPGFNQGPTHPVCGVNWEDAYAFCVWLTHKEQQAHRIPVTALYRLPTKAEWTTAAGSTKHPWGTEWPPPVGVANLAGQEARDEKWPLDRDTIRGFRDNYPRTSPVDAFPPNNFGLHDLSGNVWQWSQDKGVAYGGNWYTIIEGNTRSWYFGFDHRSSQVGFRCVLDLGENPTQLKGADH